MKLLRTLILLLVIFEFISNEIIDLNGQDGCYKVEIVNSYDNTKELNTKFPVINPTQVDPGLEKNIQNRLLTGFENWNKGYCAWKAWGTILYTEDSIYNVHGARLTLKEYQLAMNAALKQIDIQLGDFYNMIICGEWTAIYYNTLNKIGDSAVSSTVMEFVKFKDYGGDLGTRVVEGWGGTKSNDYDDMLKVQTEEERKKEEEQLNYMLNYEIPDTEDLKEKYPVLNPTEGKGTLVKEILELILKGFDSWNNGIDAWMKWLSQGYSEDAQSTGLDHEKRTMSEYKAAMKALAKKENIKKLYFDNILINNDWAAIHYRFNSENLKTGEKTAGDRMQFLKFIETDNGLKIAGSWIQ